MTYRIGRDINRVAVGRQPIRVLATAGDASVRVVLLDGLATDYECTALINLATQRLERSKVCAPGGGGAVDSIRTSDQAFIGHGEHAVVDLLDNRISQVFGPPLENGESLQVLRYRPGQEYRVHGDAFDDVTSTTNRVATCGNRIATLLVYLSDVEMGGATHFPMLDLAIHPHPGLAVWWEYPEGAPWLHDADHAGTPVIAGEKWAATKWFRSKAFR